MSTRWKRVLALGGLVSGMVVVTSSLAVAGAEHRTFPVSGSGVHYFTSSVVHSQEPTPTGMVQRSTDIIELTGDLTGTVLYLATSGFDLLSGTIVTTGTQFFSGTVAGSDPVVLHDDRFRFDVDLATGAVVGSVHFGRSADAPHKGHWFECELAVTGTGVTAAGDGMVDYEGECIARGR